MITVLVLGRLRRGRCGCDPSRADRTVNLVEPELRSYKAALAGIDVGLKTSLPTGTRAASMRCSSWSAYSPPAAGERLHE